MTTHITDPALGWLFCLAIGWIYDVLATPVFCTYLAVLGIACVAWTAVLIKRRKTNQEA